MKEIVIFGTGKIADVVFYYFDQESDFKVVAFAVDDAYKKDNFFNGLPVISFEKIEEKYPINKYSMFVAVGYQDLNDLRTNKCQAAKEKGYELVSYVHPKSSAPKYLEYGENCVIMNNVMIHPRVKLQDNNFVWSGTILGHHSNIGNNNWFTSGASIAGNVTVGDNNFFAINSTVGHSVEIGNRCFIGSNALLTKNLKDCQVLISAATKPIRLTSDQFLKMSNFKSL